MDSIMKYQKQIVKRAWKQLNTKQEFLRRRDVQKWMRRAWAVIILSCIAIMYFSISSRLDKVVSLSTISSSSIAELQVTIKALGEYRDIGQMTDEQLNYLLQIRTGIASIDARGTNGK